MHSPDAILGVLDDAARAFTFPMLDNGYVYLAATRLSLHRSAEDWAMVVEVFGFSPRSGLPDTFVSAFGSRLVRARITGDSVVGQRYEEYVLGHPNDDSTVVHPIEPGVWQGDDEDVRPEAGSLMLRGRNVPLPGPIEIEQSGIEPSNPPMVMVYEMCRWLAKRWRDEVLATPIERRANVPPELSEILVLDSWHHPDLFSEVPSQTNTFRQLAAVLATGDVGLYRPIEQANTHWLNWPDGGTL